MTNYRHDSQWTIIKDAATEKIFEDALKHSAKCRTAIRKTFHTIGKMNLKTAREQIKDNSKKRGRIYYHRINGRLYRHQASEPFQFPANRGRIPGPKYGRLKDSLDFKVTGSRSVEFGSDLEYAYYLENGTQDGKLKKRPFLKKTVEMNRGEIISTFYRDLEQALKQ